MEDIKELTAEFVHMAVDIPIVQKKTKKEEKKQQLNLNKPKAFKALIKRQGLKKGDLTKISMNDALNLLTLLLYFSKEEDNGTLTLKIEEKDISFSPDHEYTNNAIGYLLTNGYIRFKNSSINYELVTPLENNRYSYYPKDCEYQLNTKLYNYIYENKTEVIEYLEDIINDCSEISKDDVLNQWKKIGYYELLEYLKYMFNKYHFNTKHIGEAIKQKLKLILEYFSVSEAFTIIRDAVQNTGAYLPKKGIYPKIVINTIPTHIENGINTRLSKECDTIAETRDHKLPQSLVSSVFFDKMVKISNYGFEKKPSMRLITHGYSSLNNTNCNNKILNLCNELKLLIDEPNNFYIILELSEKIEDKKGENLLKDHDKGVPELLKLSKTYQ